MTVVSQQIHHANFVPCTTERIMINLDFVISQALDRCVQTLRSIQINYGSCENADFQSAILAVTGRLKACNYNAFLWDAHAVSTWNTS